MRQSYMIRMMRLRAYLCLKAANALCSASTAVAVSSVLATTGSSVTAAAASTTAVGAAAVASEAPATAWLDAAAVVSAVAAGATVCDDLYITIHKTKVSSSKQVWHECLPTVKVCMVVVMRISSAYVQDNAIDAVQSYMPITTLQCSTSRSVQTQ
jgi:hypothetical protein